MIKYMGMILIALSCTAGGFLFSERIKSRLKRIESFIRFFDYIVKHVEIYKYPLERIFADYSDDNLKSCGFLDKLAQNGRVNGLYANPWEISLEECRNEGLVFLKDEEFEIIKEFGSKLGSGHADEQICRMNLYRDKLRGLYEEEREKDLNTSKLYKISGGLVGILLCILMY